MTCTAELKTYREKVHATGGNYRFPWSWHYYTEATGKTSNNTETRLEENSIVELRRLAKRKGYTLKEMWKQNG